MLGGGDPVQQAFYAKHLLAASIMAAPATMVLAKLLIPETGTPLTLGTVRMEIEKTSSNVIDAAASGAADGLRSEEHTSKLQSLMRNSYAVFCWKKKKKYQLE